MSDLLPIPIATTPGNMLMLISEARSILARATTIDEVKTIRDKAQALRDYAKQQGVGLEVQNAAAEIKIRSERRAGEILASQPMHPGASGFHDGTTIQYRLCDLGIDKKLSHRWQKIFSLPLDDFENHIHTTKAADKELTSAGMLKLAKQIEARGHESPGATDTSETGIVGTLDELIADGRKFHTVYADPPWRYGNQATRASTDNHYDTMTVDDICAEPVAQVVENDAHLHLWTTNAFLFDARRVMEAWGFEYKSCFIWVKPQMGIGNYWRVSHEFLLFGLRGSQPFQARDEMSWDKIDRTGHSTKPDAVRVKVEKVSPGPYLEMYGRLYIPGSPWTVYGNQVEVSRRLF